MLALNSNQWINQEVVHVVCAAELYVIVGHVQILGVILFIMETTIPVQ
jgi:hypothetical protein